MRHEVPPTAGLPLIWPDLIGRGAKPDLARALSGFLGVEGVGITCSGTAALVVALATLARRSRRRTVVIPGYTCPLVPLAVARAGLAVRLCDVAANGLDFDRDALTNSCDGDTLAIVPTHLGGLTADLEPVLEVAERSGTFVVEDAAQALGATWRGRFVGTVGAVGCFSLSRGKGLTIYEGGFWTARDDDLRIAIAETVDELMQPHARAELRRIVELIGYRLLYNPVGLRVAYGLPLRRALVRGDVLHAVGDDVRGPIALHPVSAWRRKVGASALRRLPSAIAANAARGRARAAVLRKIPGIDVVDERPDTTGTWPFLMVLVRSAEIRDRILHALWSAGLGVTRLFIHDLTGYPDLETIVPRSSVPNARSFAERSFTISNSAYLSAHDFDRIYDVISRSA